MTTSDLSILTFVLALYGAVLSTILAVNEFNKGRRKVRTFLEWMADENVGRLRIVNSGHRPVTITTVNVGVAGFDSKGTFRNPLYFAEDEFFKNGKVLPQTITDGQQLILELNTIPTEYLKRIFDGSFLAFVQQFIIGVYDADGNLHQLSDTRVLRNGTFKSQTLFWLLAKKY